MEFDPSNVCTQSYLPMQDCAALAEKLDEQLPLLTNWKWSYAGNTPGAVLRSMNEIYGGVENE